MRRAQHRLERRHAEERSQLLLSDDQEAETLGFTGAR